MAALQESNIEDFAFEHLHSFYTHRYKGHNVRFAKRQPTWIGGMADGLLAFRDDSHAVFVAAINTAISKEIAFLLTRHKKSGLSRWRFLTVLVLFFDVAYTCKELKLGLLGLGLPPFAAFAGFIAHSLLERKYLFYRISRLVKEISKAPANEQWLGLSISSLSFRSNSLASHLQRICRQQGIGLITVGKRFKLVLMHEPKYRPCTKGDFLRYYKSEDAIRRVLQDQSILRVA